MPKGLLVVVAALALSSCVSFRYRAEWESALQSRARFEMRCDQVNIAPLTHETFGSTDAPLYQGAEGCGQRMVYVATTSGYVLNSGGQDNIATEPPPPPAPTYQPPATTR